VAPYKKGGEIRIGSRRENKKLHLRVEDNGPGLKEDIPSVVNQGTGIKNV
jgi:two-component sensor histidine kinase